MKKTTLIIYMLIFSCVSAAEDKVHIGHILFFETLSHLPEAQTLNYIIGIRLVMSQNRSQKLVQTLAPPSSPICIKQKMKTCHPALYGENICILKSQKSTIACLKKAKKSNFHNFFNDPAFHRVSWNSFGLKINSVCRQSKDPSCLKLFNLKQQYLMKK